ncbi:hypothetical protein [uncultured Meiothermus sp.]|jgi:hypothetical protein|uniref:hypothetical protein n=1 Tax=uncultured Meiothermus sp. TaxID=157471 RepID=UPI002618208C|nr:hypothetical protein [uncultured Meiothermus sp.]
MELLQRILRFLGLLTRPLRNPYSVLALLLALAGLLTALRGPEHLVWGCVLLWMAAVLRLLHTQRELQRKRPASRAKNPKPLDLAPLKFKPQAPGEPAER